MLGRTRGRRGAAPWLSALVTAGLLVGAGHAAAPAAAAVSVSGSPCPGTTGVTVVVDFTELGGPVRVACASGNPSSGLDALARAGFAVAQSQDFPGAVCRIDGLPGVDQQDCVGMPPANAYWSYWTASRGGSWTYSAVGAKDSHPVQGTVQGWAFGNAHPPSVPPPAAPQPTSAPTPKPTPRPTPAPTPRPTVAVTRPPAAAPTATATTADSASPSAADQPTPTPSPSDAPSTPPAASDEAVVVPVATDGAGGSAATGELGATDAGDAGSPPAGTLVGVALVVALLAGGGLLSRRRGRPTP